MRSSVIRTSWRHLERGQHPFEVCSLLSQMLSTVPQGYLVGLDLIVLVDGVLHHGGESDQQGLNVSRAWHAHIRRRVIRRNGPQLEQESLDLRTSPVALRTVGQLGEDHT
jgi:hypothetical protein